MLIYELSPEVVSGTSRKDYKVKLLGYDMGKFDQGEGKTNLVLLTYFCANKVKGKMCYKDFTVGTLHISTTLDNAEKFIQDTFLRKVPNLISVLLLSHGLETDAVFVLPTKVYLDCTIPWEVWMLLYLSNIKLRDQLLLEGGQ